MKLVGILLFGVVGCTMGCMLGLKTAIAFTPASLFDDARDLTSPTLQSLRGPVDSLGESFNPQEVSGL